MIVAFLPSDTVFTSNGERPVSLLKAIEKKDKDTWEVEISASLDYLDVIKQDYILQMPTKYGYQPFRIDNPETFNNSIHSISKHIAYDLKNYLVTLATPIEMNCTEAMNEVLTHAYPSCSFSVYSDIASIKTFSIENMTLFDAMVELSKRYNGHLDFDGFQVRITAEQGEDRGINIEYGANLQGAKVTENWDLVVTELYPVTTSGITVGWLYSDIEYDRPYARRVEFDVENEEQLTFQANLYLNRHKVPRINYEVSSSGIQNVFLGDTIQVVARQFTIFTEVISYEFNILTQKIIRLEFGNFRNTLRSFFGEMRAEIEEVALRKAQLKINEVSGDIEALGQNISLIAQDLANVEAGSSEIAARVDGVTITVTSQTNKINDLQTAVDENGNAIQSNADAIAEQKTHYDFGTDGLTIGKSDSPGQIRLEYDTENKPQVVISDGFNDTTVIKSNSMATKNIIIEESAILGNHKVQKLSGSTSVTIFLPV
jgi:phage minor structural protein